MCSPGVYGSSVATPEIRADSLSFLRLSLFFCIASFLGSSTSGNALMTSALVYLGPLCLINRTRCGSPLQWLYPGSLAPYKYPSRGVTTVSFDHPSMTLSKLRFHPQSPANHQTHTNRSGISLVKSQ